MLGGKDVDGVAPHAKVAANELGIVALILHANQLADEVTLLELTEEVVTELAAEDTNPPPPAADPPPPQAANDKDVSAIVAPVLTSLFVV